MVGYSVKKYSNPVRGDSIYHFDLNEIVLYSISVDKREILLLFSVIAPYNYPMFTHLYLFIKVKKTNEKKCMTGEA